MEIEIQLPNQKGGDGILKTLRLCRNLYADSYLKFGFLLFIMTTAMLSLTLAVGIYRYHHRISEQSAAMQTVRGAYLMQFDMDAARDQKVIQQEYAQIKALPGVSEVYATRECHVRCGTEPYTVTLYSAWLDQYFRPQDIRGEWTEEPNDVIISGFRTGRSVIGREVVLEFEDDKGKVTYSVKVSGVMGKSSYLPRFSRSGSQLILQDLLRSAYGHEDRYIIMSENSDFYRAYRDRFHWYGNFIVLFEEDLPAETVQTLETMGLLMDFNELQRNTSEAFKKNIFIAGYLMLFSGMTLVLVFGMLLSLMQEKYRELAVYAVCGCSRRYQRILCSIGVLGTTTVSFLIQSGMTYFFYEWKLYTLFDYVLIDSHSFLPIVGYALLVCLVCAASTYAMSTKKTWIDDLRENRK